MHAESELQLQLECAQTEVEFLRRRLRQSEERLEGEREARQLLDTKVLISIITLIMTLKRHLIVLIKVSCTKHSILVFINGLD